MTVKDIILDANQNIKNAVKNFEQLFEKITLDPALVENSNLAFGELMKCIKHLALIQGDITGKELMGEDFKDPTFQEMPKDVGSDEILLNS